MDSGVYTKPEVDQTVLVQAALDAAARHGLVGAVVCGVCEEESGNRDGYSGGVETWNPWAMKFEQAFMLRYIHPAIPTAPTTREISEAISYGLMQIMGETAIEFGFTDRFLNALCDPNVGVEFGCRKLRRCFDNAKGDLRAALLDYNGGSDSAYPTRVANRIAKYQ